MISHNGRISLKLTLVPDSSSLCAMMLYFLDNCIVVFVVKGL